MAEKIRVSKTCVKREKGFVYYVGKDGFVWKSPMKSNKTGTKAKVGTEKIEREKGFLYFLDTDGYVGKSKMQKRTKKPEGEKKPAAKKAAKK